MAFETISQQALHDTSARCVLDTTSHLRGRPVRAARDTWAGSSSLQSLGSWYMCEQNPEHPIKYNSSRTAKSNSDVKSGIVRCHAPTLSFSRAKRDSEPRGGGQGAWHDAASLSDTHPLEIRAACGCARPRAGTTVSNRHLICMCSLTLVNGMSNPPCPAAVRTVHQQNGVTSPRTTVASRNSKTDRNRSRPSGVPMAAAPVSMCPPAGFLLGVNRPCARNLICARARAPCVLSPRGSFRLDVPLRNRGALFAPSALGLPLGMHGARCFFLKPNIPNPSAAHNNPPPTHNRK